MRQWQVVFKCILRKMTVRNFTVAHPTHMQPNCYAHEKFTMIDTQSKRKFPTRL